MLYQFTVQMFENQFSIKEIAIINFSSKINKLFEISIFINLIDNKMSLGCPDRCDLG